MISYQTRPHFHLIVGLTGFFLSAAVVRRLKSLEEAAVRISDGDLEARANVTSKDAIGSLALRFNLMADRNQALIEKQRQLLQAVSHEFRTPTARIRFGIEMLANAGTEDEKEKRLESIDEDLAELDQLVEEILLYSRLDADAPLVDMQSIQVQESIEKQVDRVRHLRPEISIEIVAKTVRDVDNATRDSTGVDPRCRLLGDPKSFGRAVMNLLTNALRHARKKVAVHFRRAGDSIVVEVCDDGPGIPPSERESIFEPFARVDDSRNRDSGGFGLGLAIVERIMKAHHGSIEITDVDEQGVKVVTTWPAACSDTPDHH